jgi:diguanylate cyclase (GGDEF)-like protein
MPLGREKFLVILPGSPYCDPQSLAERLRCEVANSEYSRGTASFHVAVSIGVAGADQTSIVDETLRSADKALYRAKLTKNTVSTAI